MSMCRNPKSKLSVPEIQRVYGGLRVVGVELRAIYRSASKAEGIMPLHKSLGREGASGTSDKIFDSSIIKKLDSTYSR